jgi:hypothetical protein
MTVQVVNAKLQRLTNMTTTLNNLDLTLEAKHNQNRIISRPESLGQL